MNDTSFSLFKLFRFFYGYFYMVSIHYIQSLFTSECLFTFKVTVSFVQIRVQPHKIWNNLRTRWKSVIPLTSFTNSRYIFTQSPCQAGFWQLNTSSFTLQTVVSKNGMVENAAKKINKNCTIPEQTNSMHASAIRQWLLSVYMYIYISNSIYVFVKTFQRVSWPEIEVWLQFLGFKHQKTTAKSTQLF